MHRRRALAPLLAALGITLAGAGPVGSCEAEPPVVPEPPLAVFESVSVALEVAQSDAERQEGLGGHAPLGETEGMLFVFERPAFHSFWMKGMLFPLDLLWIEDGLVVHIERDAPHHPPETPDLQLPIYAPAAMASYVLEVNAGFSARYGIEVGTPVELRGV